MLILPEAELMDSKNGLAIHRRNLCTVAAAALKVQVILKSEISREDKAFDM